MDSSDLSEVQATILLNELVSFVQLGDFGLFMPNAASQTEVFLNWRPHEILNPINFIKRKEMGELLNRWRPNKDYRKLKPDCRRYLNPILDHLASLNMSIGCFDVGGYLGLYSVFVGVLAQERGISIPIRCFEPGPTEKLIQANAAINGFGQDFELRQSALTDVVGPILYEYQGGMTLSGGISRSKHTFSRITHSTTLDVEIDDGFEHFDAIIMKIDIEGFEPDALRELNKHKKRVPIIIAEVQPWAMQKKIHDRTFVQLLTEDYLLVEIGNSMWPHHYLPLEAKDMRSYLKEIKSRKGGMSDVIMIEKSLPGAEALWGKLVGLKAEAA